VGVNISAKFTKDTDLYNGLNHIEDDLADNPGELRTAVVSYRSKFGKTDFESGGESITVRIVEFEPITDPDAVGKAKQLQRDAFKNRTGNPMQDDLFSSASSGDDEVE